MNEEEDLEEYYSSVYSVLVAEWLTSKNKEALEASDFHEVVPQEGSSTFSREHKCEWIFLDKANGLCGR